MHRADEGVCKSVYYQRKKSKLQAWRISYLQAIKAGDKAGDKAINCHF